MYSQVHCNITSDLRCCLSDKGFSGFTELLLNFVQERLIQLIQLNMKEWSGGAVELHHTHLMVVTIGK